MVRRRGYLRGRARCSDPPKERASARRPPTSKLEVRTPPRSVTRRPLRHEKPGAPGAPPRQGGERPTAPASAGAEVADVDLHRGGAGVLERQGPGNVAGHTVVAEGGEQDHTGPLRAGSEVIED